MNLPPGIKGLYRHWDKHISQTEKPIEGLPDDMQFFIKERLDIWQKKVNGQKPPFTEDEILQKYRFCNILREFDRQTIEIHRDLKNIRKDFDLWLLNMFFYRMVAKVDTVRNVGLLSFEISNNKQVYKKILNHPRPKYGTPYVFPVSVIMRSDYPTRELFLTNYLPKIIPQVARQIESWDRISVVEGLEKVIEIFGFNLKFLWTEVLIDVAYQYPEYIDLFGKFPIGPGALPTSKRLTTGDPEEFVYNLSRKGFTIHVGVGDGDIKLSAENWEGVFCEYRKYKNLERGKGRKRKFLST